MVQRKKRVTAGKYCLLLGLITAVGMMSAFWCRSFVSLADSTGTVTADSAKIREKADTGSEVIGSASYGDMVSIRDEVQDASGTLWYQVYVDANTTGYIRSDLVSKQDSADDGQNTAEGDVGSSSGAPGASVGPDNETDAQYAVVSAEAIKVRMAPSTNEGVVERLTKGTQVIVSGQSDGSDGKVWYYVTFTGPNGAERTGYIRSDLLTLGDMVPVQEEEMPETPEPVPEPAAPVNNDYELTYEKEEDGSYAWYLYDYTEGQNGYKQRLQQLLDAAQTKSDDASADTKTLVRQRIAIVVLSFLMAGLIAVIVIMALKLRDVYYEDYEDEEEAEQEEETSVRRRNRAEETENAPAQRRRRTEETEEAEESPIQRRRRTEDGEDESKPESQVNTASKRKSKNFLLDDDEFEFEFLNMDDKDL